LTRNLFVVIDLTFEIAPGRLGVEVGSWRGRGRLPPPVRRKQRSSEWDRGGAMVGWRSPWCEEEEERMSVRIVVLLAIGFTLCTSMGSRAQEPCSTATLQGRYVFTGRGFIEAVEPGIQRVHYGIFVFDGAGKFSGKQSSSRGGKIGREKLEGTYTLDADCTGTMTFGAILAYGQIHWDMYVTENHKKGYLIRMDEGSMAVRSFEK